MSEQTNLSRPVHGKGIRQARLAAALSLFAATACFLAAGGTFVLAQTTVPFPAPTQQPQQPVVQAIPGQPTIDPITNDQIKLLEESGLIDKQSKLSEGLLLMDRQLRQAQLVGQLLSVLGPDAQIEVTPGEFKSFSDTPAGLRERIASLDLQLQLKQAQERLSGEAQETEVQDPFIVSGVYGQGDDLSAVVTRGGKKVELAAGDSLPDGSVILGITADAVTIQSPDGNIDTYPAP